MNALDACGLLVDTVRTLSATRARLAEVEAERDTQREINHAALDGIHDLTCRLERQGETIARLQEALRGQRRREEHVA